MSSLGIIHPPGVHGPFQDCPRLYFSAEFLSAPPKWCEVGLPPEDNAHAWLSTMPEWDIPHYHTLLRHGYEDIRLGKPVGGPHGLPRDDGWFLWPRGTRIMHEFPHHKRAVWILTGVYFPLTTTTAYEGKWPD